MVRPVQVVPAILANEPETLGKLVGVAETFAKFVQFDIMDGKFVPSRSIGYEDIAHLKPEFDWEVHLMVLKPEDYVSGFQKAGAKRIIFHYEATPEPRLVVAAGTCSCSGGIFGQNYATVGGVDKVIPVDVYIPGCPPNPHALLNGILIAIGRLKS